MRTPNPARFDVRGFWVKKHTLLINTEMKMLPIYPKTANEQIANDVLLYGPEKDVLDDEQIHYTIDMLCRMNKYSVGIKQRQEIIKLVQDHKEALLN